MKSRVNKDKFNLYFTFLVYCENVQLQLLFGSLLLFNIDFFRRCQSRSMCMLFSFQNRKKHPKQAQFLLYCSTPPPTL